MGFLSYDFIIQKIYTMLTTKIKKHQVEITKDKAIIRKTVGYKYLPTLKRETPKEIWRIL